jgi:hypothetical protein
MRQWGIIFVCLGAIGLAGCGSDQPPSSDAGAKKKSNAPQSSDPPPPEKAEAPSKYPGTRQGAEAMLKAFLTSGANHATLTKPLMPTKADAEVVFKGAMATKVYDMYAEGWSSGKMILKPKPDQTQLLLWSATTEEIQSKKGDADQFPGGYQKIAPHLQPGQTLYRFKFVKPGSPFGLAFDGLVYVNGQWRLFPKPYRAVR